MVKGIAISKMFKCFKGAWKECGIKNNDGELRAESYA
jgi:hypothetical protein